MSRFESIKGKITSDDGLVTEFEIFDNGGYPGWHQWGGNREQLATRVDALEAMTDALQEAGWEPGEEDES